MTQLLKIWYDMGTEPQMKCPCFLDKCNNEIWRWIERCSFAGVPEEWFAVIGCYTVIGKKSKKKMDIVSLAFGGNPDADTLVIVRCIRLIIGNLCREQQLIWTKWHNFPMKKVRRPWRTRSWVQSCMGVWHAPIIEERIKCGSVFSNETRDRIESRCLDKKCGIGFFIYLL